MIGFCRLRKMRLIAGLVGAAMVTVAAGRRPPADSIPFIKATVATQPGSGQSTYVVSWQAPGIRSVTVFASRIPRSTAVGSPIAKGLATGSETISPPGPAPVWYFTLVPDSGTPLTLADRSLHLAGAANFRDVGGYRTQSGAWVRMGLAYRSNELDRLSPADFAVLAQLKLHLICDLRTSPERARAVDMVPPGVASLTADVLADDGLKLRALMAPHPASIPTQSPPSAQQIYRDFVDLPSARSAYHALFMALSDRSQLPMVFHCSAGKDRSGWAAAILLTILDVPRSTIYDDYMLSGQYLQGDNLDHLRATVTAGGTAAATLSTDQADLAAAFDEVSQRYGTFAKYLHDGLGLDGATLAAIRHNFLVGGRPSPA